MRLSQAVDLMQLELDASGVAADRDYFAVKDLFTTYDGSWDVGGNIFTVPRWARDTYLRPAGAPDRFDDAGGATHLFVRVEDETGQPLHMDLIFRTTAGLIVRANTFQDGKRSGWCNLFMNRDSAFNPEAGERGPWSVQLDGLPGVVVRGLGLPFRWHVSTFVVFQRRRVDSGVVIVPPPTDGGTVEARLTRLEAEFAELKRVVMGMIADS